MSKGSKQRPTDKKAFDHNYDNIDWRSWSKDELVPELSKEEMEELLDVVRVVREQLANEEMDVTQD